jgi:putative endopeptidase
MNRALLTLTLPLTALLACNGKDAEIEAAAEIDPLEVSLQSVREAMDPQADPCEDFYRYACGGWLDATELPPDKPILGRGFTVIDEENRAVLREVIETAAADPTAGDEDWARMGNYYAACMNEDAIEAAGVEPLAPYLASIDAIEDLDGLMKAAGALSVVGPNAFFGASIYPDFKDPDTNIVFMGQSGLGLPDRDYYLDEDADKVKIREAYVPHVARMLGYIGYGAADAAAAADRVMAFETKLAEISIPRVELKDPVATYNRVERDGLEELAPELDWGAWFEAMEAPEFTALSVTNEGYFKDVNALLVETDLETLKDYLRWGVINSMAGWLTDEIAQADFDFYRKELSGQAERQPRWKRCVTATRGALSEIVGRYFVEERFAGDAKDVSLEMIDGIEGAIEEALPGLAWMDDPTREAAVAKLDAITNKIGYPDKWLDYSPLGEVAPDDRFGNAIKSMRFGHKREMDKIGQPVDRDEWYMSTAAVNAYYNPLGNEIVFPAGILQPPFFSRDFPMSMNFGGIGVVMGHEVTHGFDDSGRKFDPSGQMVEWWTPDVSDRFEEAAQCVVDQYSEVEVINGMTINGELTLGENIADIGGIKAAYSAWHAWETDNGGAPPLGEFDSSQLFFLGFAQSWCSISTPELEQLRLKTDSHSPSRYRVNTALSNVPAFAEAYSCEAGDAMVNEDICVVW